MGWRVLIAIGLTGVALAANDFEKTSITFEIDKSDRRYVEYKIPESERHYTKDIRRITLPGERLQKPIIVQADEGYGFDTAWKVLGRYLHLAKSGAVEQILPLYDAKSQNEVRAMPEVDVKKILAGLGQIDFYEFHLIIDRGDNIFAFGYLVQGGEKHLTQVLFKRVGKEFRLGAGRPEVSTAYDNALMNLLSDRGFQAIEETR